MYLTEMDNVERVMIVCDPGMVNIGYTDIVEQVLRRRKNHKSKCLTKLNLIHQLIQSIRG